MRPLLLTLLLPLALLLTSCSHRTDNPTPIFGDDDGGASQEGSLTISPTDEIRDVDGKRVVAIDYRVALANGKDVTDEATLSVDDSRIGSFRGAQFISTLTAAGKVTIRATQGALSGTTSLTLRAKTIVLAPGAPADAPTRFNGPADPMAAPELVYPPAGALIPPNLNELEFHYRPAQATLFEIAIEGDNLNLRIYTPCKAIDKGSGCAFLPDEDTWKLLANASRGRRVRVTMRGVAPAGGVGVAAAQDLSFGEEDIQGGLYYWAASSGGIMRYDFGRRGQKAEIFYAPGPFGAGLATCVGCHALSRNGKRIAVGLNIPAPSQMRALDVASRSTLFEVGTGVPLGGGSNFQAFTRDGERLITVENNGLVVRGGLDGMLLSANPAIRNANMPDVSPDSTLVVFARDAVGCPLGPLCPSLGVSKASLMTAPFTGSGFGDPKELVPTGADGNNFYPSFSPDGRYVVFNRAPVQPAMMMDNGGSYDNPKARVLVVPASGGAAIDLASVNTQEGNSWPKWAPFVQRLGGATLLWITFSSRRDYGLRTPGTAQLWMVPVDAAKLQQGKDPGYPPLWMPFQNMGTGNHIAQWVETVSRAPCTPVDTSGCKANEVCRDGFCVPGVN